MVQPGSIRQHYRETVMMEAQIDGGHDLVLYAVVMAVASQLSIIPAN